MLFSCQRAVFQGHFVSGTMPALVVIGSQWGDEGKGKLIDILSSKAAFVVRYQGGANAGHTLKVGGDEIITHLIPSAIFHPQAKCLIAGGVALDISALCEEIQSLKSMGLLKEDSQLMISDSATLLLDHHKRLDQAREKRAGPGKIGTTGRGIGPAYESRSGRGALLFADLFEEKDSLLLEKLKAHIQETNILFSHLYSQQPVSLEKSFGQIRKCRDILRVYRSRDMPFLIDTALKSNQKVLFEGAQGALLDLYYGTYPYVTSSSTLAGAALSACGLGFHHFKGALAVAKAYTTRVGSGPFPTECQPPSGSHLREKGGEFGATTGRERRCGWLDIPALKYALRLNGASRLALMKLDVLTGLDEIKVCMAYEMDSQVISDFPALLRDFKKLKPVYKSFPGWDQDLSQAQSREDLPPSAWSYIDFISGELNIPIDIISVGPSRSQTIYLKDPWRMEGASQKEC